MAGLGYALRPCRAAGPWAAHTAVLECHGQALMHFTLLHRRCTVLDYIHACHCTSILIYYILIYIPITLVCGTRARTLQVALLTVEAKEARMLLDTKEAKVKELEGQVASMQSIVQYSKNELALRARDAAELTQVKQDLMTKEQKVREMKQMVAELQMQQQLSTAEMQSIKSELDDARSLQASLEAKNSSLTKMAQTSLGREGDLKQTLNASKQQVAKLERSLRDAQVGLEQRAGQLMELQKTVKQQEEEVRSNSKLLEQRNSELEAARKAAAELERKNAMLVRTQTQELGKMSDLKQQLNVSK